MKPVLALLLARGVSRPWVKDVLSRMCIGLRVRVLDESGSGHAGGIQAWAGLLIGIAGL